MKINGRWRKVGPSVYERIDGVRIHLQGLLRLPEGKIIRCPSIRKYSKIQGSVRRGLMMWANQTTAIRELEKEL